MTKTTKTLKQLKKHIEELIESEGEDSPCLSFVFTSEEDLWWWECEPDVRSAGPTVGSSPISPSWEIAGEVFAKAEEVFSYIERAIPSYCTEKAKELHYTINRTFV